MQIQNDGTVNNMEEYYPTVYPRIRVPPEKGVRMRYWIALVLVCAIGLARCAYGQQPITLGQEGAVKAPVCKLKADAIEVANADAAGGPEAMAAVINAKEGCGMATFMARVIRVVYETKTERGTTTVLEMKVKMEDDSWATFYVLADVPIKLAGLAV